VSRLKRVKRESSRKRESLHFQTFAEQTARVPKKQFFSLTSRNAIETNSASAILCLLLTALVSLRHRQISPNCILLCALRTLPTATESTSRLWFVTKFSFSSQSVLYILQPWTLLLFSFCRTAQEASGSGETRSWRYFLSFCLWFCEKWWSVLSDN